MLLVYLMITVHTSNVAGTTLLFHDPIWVNQRNLQLPETIVDSSNPEFVNEGEVKISTIIKCDKLIIVDLCSKDLKSQNKNNIVY